MKKAALERLREQGAILGYEVEATDDQGNVTEVRLWLPPAPNVVKLSEYLDEAYGKSINKPWASNLDTPKKPTVRGRARDRRPA